MMGHCGSMGGFNHKGGLGFKFQYFTMKIGHWVIGFEIEGQAWFISKST
jgi:hypothetical protein